MELGEGVSIATKLNKNNRVFDIMPVSTGCPILIVLTKLDTIGDNSSIFTIDSLKGNFVKRSSIKQIAYKKNYLSTRLAPVFKLIFKHIRH